MAFKTGSITRFILPANILMCCTSAASVHLFVNQDYLAGWITSLVTLVILLGIPDYTKRILDNTITLIRSYNENEKACLHLPGFADELQSINQELHILKTNVIKTRETNALSAILMDNMIEHIPFALLVHDESGKVYYTNDHCHRIIGKQMEYITAYPHQYQNLISAWENIPDQQQIVYSSDHQNDIGEFLISRNRFSFHETTFFLISLKSIKSELDSRETASWQKLIRVLNHEIMNSLTPISSLSEAMMPKVTEAAQPKDLETIRSSLKLISRRSQNLMEFVRKYRELTIIPEPELKLTNLHTLIHETIQLFQQEINTQNIAIKYQLPEIPTNMLIDSTLIQQVLINLIKNSLQALKEAPAPAILIVISSDLAKITIAITDNGSGIAKEAKPNIFVPFFTTRQGGSGIGLALARQIIRLHHGEITFQSIPRIETTFKIQLPVTVS